MPRFLLSSCDLKRGEICGAEAHHIAKVHRHQVGDTIEVTGEGRVFRAVINTIDVERIELDLLDELSSAEPSVHVTLYQGLVKGDKLEVIVQKATELGVMRVTPVVCERSVVQWDSKKGQEKTARLQRIALEASKQCGRSQVPVISEPQPLSIALMQDKSDLRLMAYEGGGEALKTVLGDQLPERAIACLIGPEGGFSTAEVKAARLAGFKVIGLGPRMLRAETAPLALLSILMYELGDMGGI